MLNHSLVLLVLFVSRPLHTCRFRFLTRHALPRLHTPPGYSSKTCQRKNRHPPSKYPHVFNKKYIYLVHSFDLSHPTSSTLKLPRPLFIITTGKSSYVASSPCASLSLFVTTEGPWTSSLSNPNRGPATHTKGREKGKGQDGARVYDNTPAGIKHNIASCSSWLVSIVLSSPCPHLLRW